LTVSYLVSSYNKAAYLEAVLESVAAELAETDGEVLILDDGSADHSWDLICEFGKRDARITIRRQENRGIFNVTNQLLEFAGKTWLRIIDCDDPLISGSTALLIKTAETAHADYIFGTTAPYGPEPLTREKLALRQETPKSVEVLADPLRYAIRDYNHVPTTALIRRASIPAGAHLNEDFISCQDLALALHIFEKATVVRIDVPVCHQLIGTQNRLSANEALTYFQTLQIIKDFGATRFDRRYKHMSARKLVSRALRWMRRHKMIATSPLLYSRLLFLYGRLCVGRPAGWEQSLERAAEPYRFSMPAGRKIY
jgi:glycosyltransferase involved in cell wall biosynthesis